MFKIKVITIGKVKEAWLLQALKEYEKRLSSNCLITWVLAKDERDFTALAKKEDHFVCLDQKGVLVSSEVLSKKVMALLEQNGSRLTLLIGGADGIDPLLLQKADALISLSPLTFTHQMTRLIFLEQLFRAFEIFANSAYHK